VPPSAAQARVRVILKPRYIAATPNSSIAWGMFFIHGLAKVATIISWAPDSASSSPAAICMPPAVFTSGDAVVTSTSS
jgi:hypothetical protein